jgi:DNA polymerase-3 subunit beta
VKLTVSRKDAHAAASAVARIVDKDHTSEPCRHARLAVADGRLELSATDLLRTVWASVPCNGDGGGETCLPAKELEIALGAAQSGAEEVTLAVGERAVLSSGERRLQLPIYPADLYPKRWAPPAEWIRLPAAAVSLLVARAKPAMHDNPAVSHLAGVLLERTGAELHAVATNGGWLAFASAEVEPGPPVSVLVPRAALIADKKELPFLLGHEAGEIEIALEPARVWVRGPGFVFACQLVDGTFPDWAPYRALTFGSAARVERKPLLQAVRAVHAVTEATNILALGLAPDRVILGKHHTVTGVSRDAVAARLEGAPVRTALLVDQVRTALEKIEGDEVVLETNGPRSPARIRGAGDLRHFYLLSPAAPETVPPELAAEV